MNFSFNQYLVTGDEPLLFHTGPRQMFPLVSAAVSRVVPADQLRWVSFGHVEADECGSMNQWLGLAPRATVVAVDDRLHGVAQRPRRPTATTTRRRRGPRRRNPSLPLDRHPPRAPRLGSRARSTTKRLERCSAATSSPAWVPTTPTSTDDLIGPAIEAEDVFGSSSLAPASGRHPAPTGRPRHRHPGPHARARLHRRLPRRPPRPRRRLRPPHLRTQLNAARRKGRQRPSSALARRRRCRW